MSSRRLYAIGALVFCIAIGGFAQVRRTAPTPSTPTERELLNRIGGIERDSLYMPDGAAARGRQNLEIGYNLVVRNCQNVRFTHEDGPGFDQADLARYIREALSYGLRRMAALGPQTRRDLSRILNLLDPQSHEPIVVYCDPGIRHLTGGHVAAAGAVNDDTEGRIITFSVGTLSSIHEGYSGYPVGLGASGVADAFPTIVKAFFFHELLHLIGPELPEEYHGHSPYVFDLPAILSNGCLFPTAVFGFEGYDDELETIRHLTCRLVRERTSPATFRYARDWLRATMYSTEGWSSPVRSWVANRFLNGASPQELMNLAETLSSDIATSVGDERDIHEDTNNDFTAVILAAVAAKSGSGSERLTLHNRYEQIVLRHFPAPSHSDKSFEQRIAEQFANMIAAMKRNQIEAAIEANQLLIERAFHNCISLTNRQNTFYEAFTAFRPVYLSFVRRNISLLREMPGVQDQALQLGRLWNAPSYCR